MAKKDTIASGSNFVAAHLFHIALDRALKRKDKFTFSPKKMGCQTGLYANQSAPGLGTEAGKLDQSSRICKILRRFGSSDACHGGCLKACKGGSGTFHGWSLPSQFKSS